MPRVIYIVQPFLPHRHMIAFTNKREAIRFATAGRKPKLKVTRYYKEISK